MINRMIIKMYGSRGESRYANTYGKGNEPRKARRYRKAFLSERHMRLRSIRKRDPIKQELPKVRPMPWIW